MADTAAIDPQNRAQLLSRNLRLRTLPQGPFMFVWPVPLNGTALRGSAPPCQSIWSFASAVIHATLVAAQFTSHQAMTQSLWRHSSSFPCWHHQRQRLHAESRSQQWASPWPRAVSTASLAIGFALLARPPRMSSNGRRHCCCIHWLTRPRLILKVRTSSSQGVCVSER